MISLPPEREAPQMEAPQMSDVASSIAGEGPKDTSKTVRIAGDEFQMDGSEDDVYFGNLQAFIEGSWKLERYIKSHLQKDAVCLDIGANIGTTTLMLAKHCPDGHVYAFDADPKNIAYLRTNIARNGLTNCTVVEMAIGDKPGTLQFHAKGAHGQMMSEATLIATRGPQSQSKWQRSTTSHATFGGSISSRWTSKGPSLSPWPAHAKQ